MLKRKYPASCWDSLYEKKIAEGYIDRTAEYDVSADSVEGNKYKMLDNNKVQALIDYLVSCSRKIVEKNISVSFETVSQKQISEAQKAISEASKSDDLEEIRNILKKMFVIIPRKMKNVADFLPKEIADVPKMLEREQELLDALRTVKGEKTVEPDKTILDAYNLTAEEVSDAEKEQIIKHLDGYTAQFYKRAFKVKNIATENRFKTFINMHSMTDKNIHYYYHGSGDANYWGIITEGLSINPDAPVTGKMFGYGIYFAPKARKSLGYTDLAGSYWRHGNSNKAYLAVFKVCYKNPKHTDTCYGFKGLRKLPGGYDATYAHAGRQLVNDEIIIYDEAQCTIQYLIELERSDRT